MDKDNFWSSILPAKALSGFPLEYRYAPPSSILFGPPLPFSVSSVSQEGISNLSVNAAHFDK